MSLDTKPQELQTNPTIPITLEENLDVFYAVINRLKLQKALSPNAFHKEEAQDSCNDFLNSQMKLLFQNFSEMNFYSTAQTMIMLPDGNNSEFLQKRLSNLQVMSFAQIILYKVLPCQEKDCINRPRDVVTQNQYKDYEYECPFYHSDKDRRRLVITSTINEEFLYKANYHEDKRNPSSTSKDKCSFNYFESMFHPLYYKMFKCKREYCNFSLNCPFYHSEEEKKAWDRTFSNFIRKDRISYVKEKQKYFEPKKGFTNSGKKETSNSGFKILRAGVETVQVKRVESSNTADSLSPCFSYFSNDSANKVKSIAPEQKLEGEENTAQPQQNDGTVKKDSKSGFFRNWKNKNQGEAPSTEESGESSPSATSTSSGNQRTWRSSKKPLY